MSSRRGFSLVECVVASALCGLGLMALAGASRAMLDLAVLGHRTAGAALVAGARLTDLRSSACAAGGSGQSASGPYREQWSVGGSGAERLASVDVVFAVGGRARTAHFESIVPCGP